METKMEKLNCCGIDDTCHDQNGECRFFMRSCIEKHVLCAMRVGDKCTSRKAIDAALARLLDNPWGCDG